MAEAKHSFVDDNPYLVYSPNADATASGNSSEGGGYPIIPVIDNTITKTVSELTTILQNSPFILQVTIENELQYQYFSTAWLDTANNRMEYDFMRAKTNAGVIAYVAELNPDAYPTLLTT